jgi:uncharacterized membrane protein
MLSILNSSVVPTFMVLWWAFWIAGNVVSNITGRIYDIQNLQSASITGFLFVLSGGLTCIAAVLCIKIVREVTTRQEQRFANLINMQRYSPPPPPTFASETA